MSTLRFALTVIAILQTHLAEAKEPLLVTRLGGVGSCFAPEEPFPYKLNTTDPLYETAREEHQRYLEEMEAYVNCLDRERSQALSELKASFHLFQHNFGKNAVFQYGQLRARQN